MIKLSKKNWLNILIGIIIAINIIVISYNFIILKNRKASKPQSIKKEAFARNKIDKKQRFEFYNTPCPEITFTSINGKIINLKDLIGNVIIIRFTRFYKRDLPILVYLEHLAGKFKDKGISLILINSLGKHNSEAINKICSFSSPIIEDDGFISGLFNASQEETVIVDRDFTIKFMYSTDYNFNKSLVSNEVIRRAMEESPQSQVISNEEIASIINQLSFYDVLDRKEKHLNKQIMGRKTILTLSTSVCTGCNESFRMQLLKKLSSKMNPEKTQIIFLFGIGNNTNAIRQVALINGWNEFPITVGVINNFDKHHINNYYKLFQLNTDPRTFIINRKRQVIFAENLKNSRSINLNFLNRKK